VWASSSRVFAAGDEDESCFLYKDDARRSPPRRLSRPIHFTVDD